MNASTGLSKMDAATNSTTASAADHFQCIVCQMTTASLPRLHRHQTYQHTSEELSLSTIGLQSFNSWFCDPTKQAEFYTVSARLLDDRDNNANHCAPIDYAVVKGNIFFATDVKEEIVVSGSAQLANDYDDNANRSLPIDYTVRELNGIKSQESMQNDDFAAIGRETNLNKDLLEDAKHSEKGIKAEESAIAGTETESGRIISGEERKIEEPEVRDMEVDPFVQCVEELCSDLKKTKRKPPKRKTSPFRIPAPRKARARGKAQRAPQKKTPKSDSVSDNTKTIMQKTDKQTKISASEISEGSAGINCVERISESQKIANPVRQEFATKDIVEDRSEILESKAENRIEVGRDEQNLSNGNFVDYHLETFGSEITVAQDSADANSVGKKLEDFKQEIPGEMDLANEDRPANSPGRETVSSAAETPTELTVPWYPPDTNGYAILVFDPETHQLVWNSVSIADESSGLETSREAQVLPELTEADLRDSEICETATIASDSRVIKDESEDSSLQSRRRRRYTTEDTFDNNRLAERKPRTNFVLRPRKVTTRKSQRLYK